MKKIIFFIIFFTSNILANDLPELGSSFDNVISAAEEKKIRHQIMLQAFLSNSVIKDPEINDYINDMGHELIDKGINKKPEINFFIVNDSSINAFAMLGNIIGIHSGLILSANSESELASVLSHEIAHITQKHLLRLFDSQAKNSYKTYFALALALLVARSNPQLAQGVITAGSASQVQNILDYTRANEREADRLGLEIMNKSGYDPKGFIDFFSSMQKFNIFVTGPSQSFLRTHPVTTERISDIQDRLSDYKYVQKENKSEFYFVKSKLRAFIGDSFKVSELFKSEIDTESYINKAGAYYGLIYSLLRQEKTNEARLYFNILDSMQINNPMIIELEARLLIQEKEYEKAFNVYKQGIKEFSYYRTFLYGISELMIAANKNQEAIDILKNYLNIFKNDYMIYELLAKAYNAKNEKLLEHESLSYAFYFQYNLQEAITQIDLAVRTDSKNFFDKSRVEYRLKELKKESDLLYIQ